VEERTLALIKPHVFDDFQRSGANIVIADIQARYIALVLKIIAVRSFKMNKDFIENFYQEHINRPFFKDIVREMLSGCSFAMVLEGIGAVNKVRELNGATNPAEAKIGTLRYDYGRHEKGPHNGVHGSDSKKNAPREIRIVFGEI